MFDVVVKLDGETADGLGGEAGGLDIDGIAAGGDGGEAVATVGGRGDKAGFTAVDVAEGDLSAGDDGTGGVCDEALDVGLAGLAEGGEVAEGGEQDGKDKEP